MIVLPDKLLAQFPFPQKYNGFYFFYPFGLPNVKKYFEPIGQRTLQKDEIGQFNYVYNTYETPYYSTVQGKKPNRRMNGRPQGVCGSCQSRRRR